MNNCMYFIINHETLIHASRANPSGSESVDDPF